eukprot:9491407-Pyramimonas_sp.AAC.1
MMRTHGHQNAPQVVHLDVTASLLNDSRRVAIRILKHGCELVAVTQRGQGPEDIVQLQRQQVVEFGAHCVQDDLRAIPCARRCLLQEGRAFHHHLVDEARCAHVDPDR